MFRHQLLDHSKINNWWSLAVTVLQRKASMQQNAFLLVPAIKGCIYISTHFLTSQPTLIKLDNENIGGHLTPLHSPRMMHGKSTLLISGTWRRKEEEKEKGARWKQYNLFPCNKNETCNLCSHLQWSSAASRDCPAKCRCTPTETRSVTYLLSFSDLFIPAHK